MYILCYARIIPFIIGMNRNTHTVTSPAVPRWIIFFCYTLHEFRSRPLREQWNVKKKYI